MSAESQGNKPKQNDDKTKGVKSDTKNEKSLHQSGAAAVPNVNPSPEPTKELKHKHYNSKHWLKEAFEYIAIAAAIILAIVSIFQWQEMREDRILDERAWISVYAVTSDFSDNTHKFMTFRVNYKNIGKTPALHVIGGVQVFFSTDFNLIKALPPDVGGQLLTPDIPSFTESVPIPIAQVGVALNNGKPVYLVGGYVYDDIFGKRHWIRFCWAMDMKTGRTYPSQTGNYCDPDD